MNDGCELDLVVVVLCGLAELNRGEIGEIRLCVLET